MYISKFSQALQRAQHWTLHLSVSTRTSSGTLGICLKSQDVQNHIERVVEDIYFSVFDRGDGPPSMHVPIKKVVSLVLDDRVHIRL